MTEKNVKKDILNLAGEISSSLLELLQKGEFNLCTELSENVSFILVNDWKEGWTDFANRYQPLEKNIVVVSLSAVLDKAGFFAINGKAVLDQTVLSDSLIFKVVQRLFFVTSSVNIDYAYDQLLKKVYAVKVMGQLTSGYYLDGVSACALEQDFDVISLRSFYVSAVSYFSYLEKAKIAHFPIDVQYGYSENCFVLQFILSVGNIYSEYLLAAMKDPNIKHPLKSLLTLCEQQADFVDIYELKQTNKLIFSGLWTKNKVATFHSVFINNLVMFSAANFLGSRVDYLAVGIKKNISNVENKKLPGDGITPLLPHFEEDRMVFLKIMTHLQWLKESANEMSSIPLTLENLEQRLQTFEDQDLLGRFNALDKGIILEAWNKIESDGFKNFDVIVERIENWKFAQNKDESSHVVSGSVESDDSIQVVSGQFEIDQTKIKVLKISDKLDKDKWRAFRGELAIFLRSLRNKVKKYGDVESSFIQKISGEFGLSEDDSKLFINELKNEVHPEAGVREIEKMMLELKEKVEKEKNKISEAPSNGSEEIKNKNLQIIKLKRIVEIIKKELDETKKMLEFYRGDNSGASGDSISLIAKVADEKAKLQDSIGKLEADLQSKDLQISSFKDSLQVLNEKYESLLKDHPNQKSESGPIGVDEHEELLKLRAENQTLTSIVEMSNKKITTLSENYDKLKKQYSSENEKIIKDLKQEDAEQKQLLKQSEKTIKSLEQKVKVISEQLVASQKGGAGKGGSSAEFKAADNKVKQLEVLLEKNLIATNKMKDELVEKKKENLKLKTELQTLQNQHQETQRKMGVLEKKRAA